MLEPGEKLHLDLENNWAVSGRSGSNRFAERTLPQAWLRGAESVDEGDRQGSRNNPCTDFIDQLRGISAAVKKELKEDHAAQFIRGLRFRK